MLSRIKTKEEIERKKKRNQILIGTALIVLLSIAPLGYSLFSSDKQKNSKTRAEEGGLTFNKINGLWRTSFDSRDFGFQYLPSEVSNVSIKGTYDLGSYAGRPIYFVNPNEGVPEVLNNLGQYALRYQEACISQEKCKGDIPLKGCDSNLIIFVESNKTEVYKNESCVYIAGDPIRGSDKFLYEVLKIK